MKIMFECPYCKKHFELTIEIRPISLPAKERNKK